MRRFSTSFVLIFAIVLLTCGTAEVSEGQVCKVGDIIKPGERCQDPGTGKWFRIFHNQEITGIVFSSLAGGIVHTDIDSYSESLDESNYFAALKRVDGSWEIKSVTHLKPLPTKVIDPGSPPIYWAAFGSGRIQRANLNGSNVENLITGSEGIPSCIALDMANGKIYWAGSHIQRADLNGKNIETLLPRSSSSISSLALDVAGGKIYWGDASGIKRADLEGKNIKNLVRGVRFPKSLVLDVAGGKMYWGKSILLQGTFSSTILRAELNGNNIEILVSGLINLGGLALDVSGGKMYWTERFSSSSPSRIKRANLNGKNIETLVPTLGSGRANELALDVASGKMYWTESSGKQGAIKRANLNGENIETLVSGVDTPRGIALDISAADISKPTTLIVLVEASQRPPIYWIDAKAGTLHRLIGDEVENLIPSVKNATSLAVDVAGDKLYWTTKTNENWGKIYRVNLNGTPRIEELKDLYGVPLDIAVDPQRDELYWIDALNRIQRADLSVKTIQNIAQNLNVPKHITLDVAGGHIYWTEQTGDTTGKIRGANLDGSNVRLVKDLTSAPRGLALDAANQKLYLTNGWGKVQRLNPNGSNFQSNLITGLDAPKAVFIDVAGRKIYWTEQDSIRRADLNGENIEEVVTGLVSPSNIVLGIRATPPATTNTPGPSTTPVVDAAADVNQDKKINKTDLLLVVTALGEKPPAAPNFDVNADGIVNIADVLLVIEALDDPIAAAAPMLGETITALDPGRLTMHLDILRAESDGSLKYEHAIAFFQALLASLRPLETQLLTNYPNPFNPETWIPYRLAKASDVKITIYDARGVVVREWDLGHQAPGFYTSRSRATYWDGRNDLGERVASGIYFYQLQADNVSSLRKMLILK